MQVDLVTAPGASWDSFVESRPEAALGHAAAWARVCREAYGLPAVYLHARAGGSTCGVMPAVLLRTLRGRRELVSLPFLDVAGPLAESPDAERALLAAALEQLRKRGASHLEVRASSPVANDSAGEGHHRVNLLLPLESDAESQWKALPGKVRNQTRKAEREGLRISVGEPQELLRRFYAVFRVNMRDLGSPVHGRRFFEAILLHFEGRVRIVVTERDGRPVGGLVAIRNGARVSVPWASTLRSERARCPNNQIYWEAIRWAIDVGAREFEFGRSPVGSGTWRFKKGWGAAERPLAWTRLAPDGTAVPLQTAGQSPLLRRLSGAWQRLPVGVASALGPHLRRHLAE